MSSAARFHAWLKQVLPDPPIPGVVAYNFNIAETLDSFVIEIVGSTSYHPSNSDWACEETWTSRPHQFLCAFTEVGRQWEPFLLEVRGWVKEFFDTLPPQATALLNARAVTVGFVDGGLVEVRGGKSNV
jgi:hypothetical protein